MVKRILEHKLTKLTIQAFFIDLQIALFLILPFIVATLIASKSPILAGIRSFVVQTGSMTPTIPVGSMVYTQKALSYGKDDIITFENKAGQTVTHRIVEVVKKDTPFEKEYPSITEYKTQGDANNVVDTELISHDKIVGKYFFSIPLLGKFISFFKTIQGFLLFIIVPSTMFIVFELWNIKKEIEKSVEKRLLAKMNGESSFWGTK